MKFIFLWLFFIMFNITCMQNGWYYISSTQQNNNNLESKLAPAYTNLNSNLNTNYYISSTQQDNLNNLEGKPVTSNPTLYTNYFN